MSINRVNNIIKQVEDMTVQDIKWKNLYPNNMPCNGIEGIYCVFLHENEDGTFDGRKYTIYNQLPITEDGIICMNQEPEFYILFEKTYTGLKSNEGHPEPCNKLNLRLRSVEEELDACEVNDYGDFRRAYISLEDAKKGVLRDYKQSLYMYRYMLSCIE